MTKTKLKLLAEFYGGEQSYTARSDRYSAGEVAALDGEFARLLQDKADAGEALYRYCRARLERAK